MCVCVFVCVETKCQKLFSWNPAKMRKDTATAGNKQLPKKSLFSYNQMPPESSSRTDHSGEGLNRTPTQTTTAPEHNLVIKTPFTTRTMAVSTHRDRRRNTGKGVNSQCASVLLGRKIPIYS